MPPSRRLPILLAIACALFLRTLVPAGWMPAADRGAFAIQPCPAADPAPVAHMASHHHGKTHHSDHGASHNGDCAFSPFSTAFTSADALVTLTSLTAVDKTAFALHRAGNLKTGPPALPPPSTGPPAIA